MVIKKYGKKKEIFKKNICLPEQDAYSFIGADVQEKKTYFSFSCHYNYLQIK